MDVKNPDKTSSVFFKVEMFCPKCNSSIIDWDKKPLECWKCEQKLPKLVKHFLKRKMARMSYFKGYMEKDKNA